MKKITVFALALALASLPAFATTNGGQVDTTATTISAALTTTTNPICVASATGIVLPSLSGSSNGSYLIIDQEIVQVRSAPTTLCFQVVRGMMGSPVTAHLNAALVWVAQPATGTGDSSRPFSGGALSSYLPSGQCVQNQQFSLPIVIGGEPYGAQRSGQAWTCWAATATAQGKWGPVNPMQGGPTYGGTVASVAGAQPVPGTTFTVSGALAITSFTLPTGFLAGSCLQIVPSGAFTATATNNIGKASTAVVGITLTYCYDGTKLWPSY